jgi:hypothetical protein
LIMTVNHSLMTSGIRCEHRPSVEKRTAFEVSRGSSQFSYPSDE